MTATERILAVDSDPLVLSELVGLLMRAGYDVRGATSYEAARRLIAAEPPHVLITNVRLGPFNGLQLVARARFAQAGLAAIVVTDFPDAVLAREARSLGATYLVRPVSPAGLLARVAEATTNQRRDEIESRGA
jgi:DNA-binding response OmpR family regulator